jgi:uncharacterized protein (DUF1330 family)
MSLFKPPDIEEYIQKSKDIASRREFSRLPTKIPVTWYFPDSEEEELTNHYTSNTIDISSGGLKLKIISPDEKVVSLLYTKNQKIFLKIKIKKDSKVINVLGTIVRVKTEKKGSIVNYLTAVQFNKIDLEARISLINHAIRLSRKRIYKWIGIVFLVIGILTGSMWGIKTILDKKAIEKYEASAEEAMKDIYSQTLITKLRIEEIEDNLYETLLSSGIEIIEIQNSADSKVIKSPSFKKARDLYKNGKYSKAIKIFNKLRKKYRKISWDRELTGKNFFYRVLLG